MDLVKETEKIAQATRLPIVCLQGDEKETEQWERERMRDGWEVVCSDKQGESRFLVMIQPADWHPSARAMLQLYFPQRKPDSSLPVLLSSWLGEVVEKGRNTPLPPQIDQQLAWREGRVCFLLERSRLEGAFSWQELRPLLDTFFGCDEPARLSVLLGRDAMLLIVPLSQLGQKREPEDLLEWAYSLHDLIACEVMEPVRLLVSQPIETPARLGQLVLDMRQLSAAIHRYRPKAMVAGIWQHALERWAASLEETAALDVAAKLSQALSAVPLSAEQIETLETLFAHQLNVSETARHLFMHRNSLLYRLDKLTEQTGLDPRLFPDAVLLQLYLFFGRK